MSKFSKLFSATSIRNASIASVVIKFASAFFAFLNGVLLARLLGVEGLGYYVLAFTTMTLLSVPAALGIPNLLVRYISKYNVHENLSMMKGLLIKSNQFVFFTSALIFAISYITYFFWWKHYNNVLVETLIYSFLLIPLLGFGGIRAATLRGLKFIVLAELPETIMRNILFTVFLLAFVFFDYTLTPQIAIILQVIAAALSFILGYYFLQKKLLNRLKQVQPEYQIKEWIQQAIPFSINSGVQIVKSKLLVYVLAIFGSIEAVAIFDVAVRGASLVTFTMNSLNAAISPYLSAAYEEAKLKNIQTILTKASRAIFILSLPVALAFILGGEWLLTLVFGKEYTNAYIPLVILCVGNLVSATTGSVGVLLSMTGRQKVFSNSNVLMLVLSVILSIPMIIYFDTVGAAIVFASLLIIQNFMLFVYVRKHMKLNTTIF
ncbi:flippase [Candidatus Ulvibacter alkanivorans]|uniref:flippase n=1 Tax=Candidatus Ulvibacter alkanivorans TaxID=2267620 RepID=UPI000DF1FF21|nr:flippase [Candidatus Ulvibacter alkanivorans]